MITDEFDDPKGRWNNYDPADLSLNALRARAHTNVRSFNATITRDWSLFNLQLPMEQMDEFTMEELSGEVILFPAEGWTNATIGADATGRQSLTITLAAGQTVTAESMADPVDLTGWAANDTFTLSLPDFPGEDLDLENCSVELEEGGNTISLPFPSPLPTGNTEVSWPMSALGNILRPTVVRIILAATNTSTVRIAAIRVLASTWTATRLDTETIRQRLIPTVDRDGSVPTDPLPRLWRSAEVPGSEDPRPINSRLAVNFHTGAKGQENSITVFMRQHREDYLTQLDLDGTVIDGVTYGETQASLAARRRQPDYGQAVYDPRAQDDLDRQTQASLNSVRQFQLERIADTISESYIYARLDFGATTNQITIGTTETQNDEDRYVFPADLPVGHYLLTVDLEDASIRVQVFDVDSLGGIGSVVADSTLIADDFKIKRRKGRVGWQFDLNDGDSWIESVRSRGLMFGEVITNSYESMTPVEGAQIFVGATPPIQLITGFEPVGNPTFELDNHNTRSADGSFRITGDYADGVRTSLVAFEDFAHSEVKVDLFFPRDALAQGHGLIPLLINQYGYVVTLAMPLLSGDRWQTVRFPLNRAIGQQTGLYRFVLQQDNGPVTWWVDNLEINQATTAFSGRAVYDDPWNRFDRWIEFGSLINSDTDGVVFPERGRFLQLRGQALTQSARISKLYAKPKYAELGRLTWDVGRRYRGSNQ